MRKVIDILAQIMIGLLFIASGIIFIIYSNFIYKPLFIVLAILMFVLSFIKLINLINKKQKIFIRVLEIILNLIIGLWLITNPRLFIILASSIFGLYALLQALSDIINIVIYKHNHIRGIVGLGIKSLTNLVFFCLLTIGPYRNYHYVFIVIGIYLIIHGCFNFINLFCGDEKFKLPLPVILTMFLPKFLIKRVNKENRNVKDKVKESDLEILIHLAPNGSAAMGHVEISFLGKIYSYSCYNYKDRKLFGGVGDGIMGVFDHDSYIKYCVNVQERFIISYGLKLNDQEKEKVQLAINKLLSNTEEWYPDAHYEKKVYKEMANHLYTLAEGKFYRFIRGKYKTFFVLRTNCVAGAEEIIDALGTKLIRLEGIISPGTYYSYLESEYRSNKKFISKIIYTKDYIKKKKYKYKKDIDRLVDN